MAATERGPSTDRAWTALRVLLTVGFVAAGLASVTAPPAVPRDAAEADFSAERAFDHVGVIAAEPHPMGSPAIAEVRRYLVAQLEQLGLEAELQASSAPDYYGRGGSVEVVNVAATIRGTAGSGSIVLMAHYDTVPTTPGGNDNSAAVAALLEAGRALLAGPPVDHDVILLFTDGEEPAPRFGSSAFLADPHNAGRAALVVNFEAAGGSGPVMLVETSGPEAGLIGAYAAAVPRPVAFSFLAQTAAWVGEIGTDFDPFRDRGIPGYNVTYLRGSPIYHTAADAPEAVSLASLQHHGSIAVGLVRHFGERDLAALPEGGGTVYFTLRPWFVRYPAAWSVAAAVLAGVLLAAAAVRRYPSSFRGAGRALLATLAATVTATAAWLGLTAVRATPSVAEGYLALAGVLVVGAGVGILVVRRRPQPSSGFGTLWVVLAVITALAAPGFGYLFVWPALAAGIAALWRPTPAWLRTARWALVAAPTLILATPALEFFFQMGQPRRGNPDSDIPAVAAVAFLIAVLAGGLLYEVWQSGEADPSAAEVT